MWSRATRIMCSHPMQSCVSRKINSSIDDIRQATLGPARIDSDGAEHPLIVAMEGNKRQ